MNALVIDSRPELSLSVLKRVWPRWLPMGLVAYLAHTEFGVSIRAISRAQACHASTISRQIRRWELLRDDTLIDAALSGFEPPRTRNTCAQSYEDFNTMTIATKINLPDDETLSCEARRVLRRMSEPGAVLALAGDMEKGVVVRETTSGTTLRTAIVERDVAQALALKEWISCGAEGRVARYRITNAGRSALNRLLAEAENRASGFSEAASTFEHAGGMPLPLRKAGYSGGESPLMLLGRRREKEGELFLSSDLVSAGERLREDFELSQLAPCAFDWSEVISGAPFKANAAKPLSPEAAQNRVAKALGELGPGLGDVALRCCCNLEGLESAERSLGWSARSGKIVLRIALGRLAQHYAKTGGGDMIG